MALAWIKQKTGKKKGEAPADPARVAKGRVVYAIGDIHGHHEELGRLLGKIGKDAERRDAETHLVFLGDYIDRGPDSAGVLDRLVARDLPCDRHHFLMGNHESSLLAITDYGAATGANWLGFGGFETLESYGLKRKKLLKKGGNLAEIIRDTLPEAHLDFLRGLRLKLEIDDYLFVHAGVRPGVDLDAQDPRDLLWIRDDFISSRRYHGKVIVHGHTIHDSHADEPHRIGIDTGCYAGGALTAVRLKGKKRAFLSVDSRA
ncbi:metallophosphoesterase family protein [Sphingomicrobium nitratireducens]|uniref:metallophosphoesterase family protein n=1 Tax=Sphingomicrobium nitratireducens TaxID=2964666 RepID=UPI00223F1B03|nr:metallophosphoesterase family protein [Sphingomicrobium nitratireducens]